MNVMIKECVINVIIKLTKINEANICVLKRQPPNEFGFMLPFFKE